MNLVSEVEEKGASLQSLNDPIDTTTSQGKLIFHIFATLAEFERDIISERTKARLAAARARGRKGGRPKGLFQKAQNTAILVEQPYKEQKLSIREICAQLSISKVTFYHYMRHQEIEVGVEEPK